MTTRLVSFAIEGMYCARCAGQLERALTPLEGVIAVQVNYAAERATVVFEPRFWDPVAVVTAIRQAGFTTPVERSRFAWPHWYRATRLPADALVHFEADWQHRMLTVEMLPQVSGDRQLGWGGLLRSIRRALRTTAPAVQTRIRSGERRWVIPAAVGLLGALALIGLYLDVLALLQSPSHALDQLATDLAWVTLIASGFGIQLGLYAYLRRVVHAMKLAGASAVTGAGTGASTLGMLACCVHHLADVIPLVSLVGVGGLSGLIGFLIEWKIPFIVFGLGVNLIGIVNSIRTIRGQWTHLANMERAAAAAPAPP